MNVLSLFDGMSCGQIALERAGIKVDNYFASEIDKYAIQVAMKNYPNTIQLGDVVNIRAADLPPIDLLIGGSPCQGFSFAGKQLNFDDPRSRLFFEFVRLLKECRPRYFLLENVKMKKEYEQIITDHLGVEPILINSALVSAQNRKRLYWTNIAKVTQPQDRGVLLRDVVLDDTHPIILHNLYGGFGEKDVRVFKNKAPTIRTASGGRHIPSVVKTGLIVPHEKINSPVFKENYLEWDINGKGHGSQDQRAYYLHKKHGAIPAIGGSSKVKVLSLPEDAVYEFFLGRPYREFRGLGYIRQLHPIECERLQTIPDNYTEGVSNSQRYKMIGNGWTVDVIAHIFSFMELPGPSEQN